MRCCCQRTRRAHTRASDAPCVARDHKRPDRGDTDTGASSYHSAARTAPGAHACPRHTPLSLPCPHTGHR